MGAGDEIITGDPEAKAISAAATMRDEQQKAASYLGVLKAGGGISGETYGGFMANVNPGAVRKQSASGDPEPTYDPMAAGMPLRPPPPATLTLSGGSSSKLIIPEEMKKADWRLSTHQAGLEQQAAAVRAQVAAEQSAALQGSISERTERMSDWQARDSARRAAVDTEMASLQKAYASWEKKSVDPQHAWEVMTGGSTAKKIALGLVMGIGGGDAYKAIDSIVQRQIDADKFNLEKEGKVLGARQSLLGHMRAVLGDERAAFELTDAKYRELAADVVRGIAAKSSSDLVKIQGGLVADKLEQAANQRQITWATRHVSGSSHQVVNPEASEYRKRQEAQDVLRMKQEAGQKDVKGLLEDVGDMKNNFASGSAAAGRLSAGGRSYEFHRKTIGLRLWKMIDNGRLSDQDAKMAFSMFFPEGRESVIPFMRSSGLTQFDLAAQYVMKNVGKTQPGAETDAKTRASTKKLLLGQ